jgi:hypothetical protein
MNLDNLTGRRLDAEKQVEMRVPQRYEAPKLVRYGSVAELTEVKSTGAKDAANRRYGL